LREAVASVGILLAGIALEEDRLEGGIADCNPVEDMPVGDIEAGHHSLVEELHIVADRRRSIAGLTCWRSFGANLSDSRDVADEHGECETVIVKGVDIADEEGMLR